MNEESPAPNEATGSTADRMDIETHIAPEEDA
jgi:hypothetical protein